jgi:hypothetical protein
VPLDLLARLAVQHKAERALALVHLARDVVAAPELVAEALAVGVEQEAAHATQRLGGEELHLGVGLAGVHQAGGVDLHGGHVDRARAHADSHLDAVASAVVAVGGGKRPQLGPVLRQQRVGLVVRAEPAGGDDHGAVLDVHLAVLLELDADDGAGVGLDEPLRLGFGDDAREVAFGILHHLLQTLHQRVRDGEPGETLLAAVRAGVRVAA